MHDSNYAVDWKKCVIEGCRSCLIDPALIDVGRFIITWNFALNQFFQNRLGLL